VLWSRKAVFAVAIVVPIILDTDAGEDPIAAKFGMPGVMVVVTQFCACAPEAAKSDTARVTPAVTEPRVALAEPLGFTDADMVSAPAGTDY